MDEKKERKVLKFRRKAPVEQEAEAVLSTDEKLEQLKQNAPIGTKDIFVERKSDHDDVKAEVCTIDKKVVSVGKPRDVSAEIAALIRAYKGDLLKVQQFIIETFEDPQDLYNAGFQICLIITNDRLAKENALRTLFMDMHHGVVSLPFDPREDPLFLTIVKRMIPSQVPRQVPEKVTIKTPVKVPAKEEYTSRSEQELAEIHAMLDGPAGVSQ